MPEKGEGRDRRVYSISVGGFHLMQDGDTHKCEIGSACRYDNMNAKHVQAFWKLLTTEPRLAQAQMQFMAAIGPVLQEFGNKYGLKKKRLDEADIAEIEDVVGS